MSAAALHGFSVWTSERRIHLVQLFKSSSRDHALDVVKTYRPDATIGLVDGLPCTESAETVIDCLRVLPVEPAMILCESALWQRSVDDASLLEAVNRARHRRGVAAARAIMARATALSESAGETRTRLLLESLPIPRAVQQFEVLVEGSVYRLDFAWPDLRVALEFDGLSKYVGDEPTDQVLLRERARENALVGHGWVIVRITWADLTRPERVHALISAAFDRSRRYRSA
ncbi:hypothetical protein [Sinomonas sp. ASV322]|uniref:hypothetical protein n=1 Tax=Sinomonas sp. ASV322 TaxID=3041920 RepID=UPI0027DAFF39|nr:hypothetical protein [Sinomonas sp. ASV322]MDQ4503339.1 hypothetical protein [Sinomonas sp. ASV322]